MFFANILARIKHCKRVWIFQMDFRISMDIGRKNRQRIGSVFSVQNRSIRTWILKIYNQEDKLVGIVLLKIRDKTW